MPVYFALRTPHCANQLPDGHASLAASLTLPLSKVVVVPWLLVKHRLLVASASWPSLILTMNIHKPRSAPTPPVLSPGLQSRATTEHAGDAGALYPHSSNGFDERCVIYAFSGTSSPGGSFASHNTPIPTCPLLLHPSLGHLSEKLGHFYSIQHCPSVSPAETLSIPCGPCQDVKS